MYINVILMVNTDMMGHTVKQQYAAEHGEQVKAVETCSKLYDVGVLMFAIGKVAIDLALIAQHRADKYKKVNQYGGCKM